MGNVKHDIHGKADYHDAHAIYGESQGGFPQGIMLNVLQVPPPFLSPLARIDCHACRAAQALDTRGQSGAVLDIRV